MVNPDSHAVLTMYGKLPPIAISPPPPDLHFFFWSTAHANTRTVGPAWSSLAHNLLVLGSGRHESGIRPTPRDLGVRTLGSGGDTGTTY